MKWEGLGNHYYETKIYEVCIFSLLDSDFFSKERRGQVIYRGDMVDPVADKKVLFHFCWIYKININW